MHHKGSTVTSKTGMVQSPNEERRKSSSNMTIQDNNFDCSDNDEDGSCDYNDSYDPYVPRKE